MSRCRNCAYCIEYEHGDARCSYGKKKGVIAERELDEEHGCKMFVSSLRRNKILPSDIKIGKMSHKCYKGDAVAMKYQTTLF